MDDQRIERGGRCRAGPGQEGARVESVERLQLDLGSGRDGDDLARQGDEDRAELRLRQAVGDRFVGEGGGEQQRAIGELAPQIAPDVRRQHRLLVEDPHQAVDLLDARRGLAVQLAHHHGAMAGIGHDARRQIVCTEIDEGTDGALLADARGNHLLVEAVLQRDDVAVVGHERRQRGDRVLRVVRLYAQEGALEPPRQIGRQAGGGRDLELLDRAGDLEAALPHRLDMLGAAVDEQHGQAVAAQIRADGPADRAGAPDQDCIVCHYHLVSMSARVSSTATAHSAFMSSSDFS